MNIELRKQTRLLTKDKVCRENIDIIPVLQQKTVTEPGIVMPDSGYVGLSRVDVNMTAASGSVLDSLDNPLMPKLGRLKYFENSRSEVRYKDCYPTSTAAMTNGVNISSGSFHSATLEEAIGKIYANGNRPVGFDAEMRRVVVEGKAYDVYYYTTDIAAMWVKTFKNGAANVGAIYIPPCVCKIAKYIGASGNIEVQEFSISGTELPAVSTPASSGMYSCAMSVFDITWNAMMGGNIVGAEFLYQKHNVSISGSKSGLQYSTDDGITFADVASGLALNQVEHVVFKNGSTGTVKIGSTAGASDYASIPAGATMAVAAIAGGTWYVT